MRTTIKLVATLAILLPWCLSGAVQNVAVQGTSPTQAVIAFTVPDPNDCLVQVSTDPAFGSYVDDTNDTLFPGSQKCNRAGSTINGNDVVFVVGLRTSQKATDGRFHSRALKCNTPHFYRIVSQFQPDPSSPRNFQTENLPLGATFPEPPPFDPTLTAFGNYAWPEFDWSDPTKSVIDPLTGMEVKQFTRPGARGNYEANLQWATPFDIHGLWTGAANAATNGTTFATTSGGPTDYLFLPLPYFKAPTGAAIGGWFAGWGFDDILVRPYGSAAVVDGTHNVVSVCLSIDSGQTCASSAFNVTLTGSSGATALVPATTPKALFANWALTARQGQKVPVIGNVTVSGSTVTQLSPYQGQYFDITMASGSKIFITGSSSMAPTPCTNNMCTVVSVTDGQHMVIAESCATSGCPVNQPFTGAGFGLRVAKTVSTGSVSVSFGYDRATSQMTDAGVNGANEYCNRNPLTVAVDRTGAALAQNLAGYLCTSGSSDLFLLIPSNADGTPRGEVRLLSTLLTSGFTSNHLVVGQSALYIPSGGFDTADGTAFYSTILTGGKLYILKGKYDTTATDGDGRACDYRDWPLGGAAAQYANSFIVDCVRWTSVQDATASPAQDVQSQLTSGYQTGLNNLGETVTNTPHAGYDFTWMSFSPYTYMGGGLGTIFMSGSNNISGAMAVIGTFDLTSGVLKQVVDTWSQLPARYGSCHGCAVDALGIYRTGGMNNTADVSNGQPFNGAWQAQPIKVNRANSGSTPNWDTNTALAFNEGYTCPTFSQDLIDLGGSGANCIQVKVPSEACSHIPSASFMFANGQTEVQKFPCSTNVGGTYTVPSGASSWSKLQDTIVGDWLQDMRIGFLGGTEKFIIASKTVNAANDIDLWLIRWAGCHGAKFPPGLNWGTGDGTPFCYYPNVNFQDLSNHLNAWSFMMSPPFSDGTSVGSEAVVLQLSLTNPWLADNWIKTSTHGSTGASPTDGNFTNATPQGSTYLNSAYSVLYDRPFLNLVYAPIPVPSVTQFANFAGKSGGPGLQNYVSALQYKAPPSERVWALDYRHISPAAGNGPEAESGVRNGQLTCSQTLQSGTTQTYLLATDVNGRDCLSLNPTPDRKRLPMVGAAGRYLLKDYSSAATGNVFGDAKSYGFCIANAANECRTGSTIGQQFVSIPSATPSNGYCYSDQYPRNIPCVFTNAAPTAQMMQFDLSVTDSTGAHQRRLGYGLAGPLRQYQFNNVRATPDGKYIIFPGNWVDGQRRELMIAELPPWPKPDAYDRTTFVPTPVSVAANSNAVSARVRFGYAENGPPDSLFCTTRQESCSTDIPAQAATDPYSFVSETPTPTNCGNGCTINIPGISERVVYYVIDWISTTGTVVQSSPLHAQVVAGTVQPTRRRPTFAPNVLLRNSVVR